MLECAPSHSERVVSFEDLRLDPVLSRLGVRSSCSNNSSTNDVPSSGTTNTSGLDSAGEQSTTPTTVSFNSSSSLHKSHPLNDMNGVDEGVGGEHCETERKMYTTSSIFSSQCTGRQTNIDFVDVGDEDDEDDDDFGELDFTNEMTTMEIILPHELLEKNLQIRVSPDVDNFDIIYRTTFYRTNPIIIYCFERYNEKLTDIDISHLEQLRQMMPSTPILFAHIIDFDPTYNTCRLPPGPHTHLPAHLTNPYTPTFHTQNPQQQQQRPQYPSFEHYINRQNSPLVKGHEMAPAPTQPQNVPFVACNQCELTESEQFWSPQCQQYQGDSSKWNTPTKSNNTSMPPILSTDPNGGCFCLNGPNGSIKSKSSTTMSVTNQPHQQVNGKSCSHIHHHHYHHESASHYCDDVFNYIRSSESIWNELKKLGFFQETPSTMALQGPLNRQQKRLSNGYYIISQRPFKCTKQNADYGLDVSSRFICHSYEFCYFVDFFRSILKSNLMVAATLLNEIHNQFIQYYIFSAFDMTWRLNFSIPKRLEYARNKEAELYMSLMGIANRKQEEIRQLIGEMLEFMRDDILNQASNYTFTNPCLNKQTTISAAQVKDCIEEIQEFVFIMLNRAIAIKLISSVDVMRESFIGKHFGLSVYLPLSLLSFAFLKYKYFTFLV